MLVSLLFAAALGFTTSKPLAVMIHGAGGGGWEYRQWKPVFEKVGFEVVAPDLMPATGGLGKTSFEDYVGQVGSWVPKGRRPLVVIGASMGGPLALRAAERLNPDALILVNGVAPAGLGPKKEAKTFPEVVEWANGPRQDSVDSMPDSDAAMIDYAWKRWRNESGSVMRDLSRGVECRKPSCPVLVIIGAEDGDVPPDGSRAMAEWAKADTFTYAGTSHVGPLLGKRGSEIASAALAWLKSHGFR